MVLIDHIRNGMKASHGLVAAATTPSITTTAAIYSHEVGNDLIPELAMRVYSSHLDSFREAISNSFDENSQKVALSISNEKIVIEDWGMASKITMSLGNLDKHQRSQQKQR